MPQHKDVVVTILGASAGLAGLVLVFLAAVAAAYQTSRMLPPPEPEPGKGYIYQFRFASSARNGVIAFLLSLACVTVATAWLVDLGDNHSLYVATIVLFGIQLLLLARLSIRFLGLTDS